MTTPALNDDLVRRLKLVGAAFEFGPDDAATAQEAATALETLAAENAALRSALEPFVKLAENYEGSGPSDWVGYKGAVYVHDLRRARTASQER